MVAAGRYVEYGVKRSCLTRRGKHSGSAALKLANFGGDGIAGGVLQARIEISACFQIEKSAHILTCVIFKGRALNYRYLPRLAVTGSVAALHANGISVQGNHSKLKILQAFILSILFISFSSRFSDKKYSSSFSGDHIG